MKNIILLIKGFIMGIANIIPGVSGGTLALTLGIYEDFIKAISHFFSKLRENIKFLLPVGIGIVLSIVSMSRVIDYSYDHFPIPTMLFFMGLVVGGIPFLLKKVKNSKEKKQISSYIIMAVTFVFVIILACSEQLFNISLKVDLTNVSIIGFILLFIVGMVAAATMVIPGVSGSLVLMLLGYYYPIISLIKELTKFKNLSHNIVVTFVFGLGILVGIVLVSKLIEYLFAKHEAKTYFGVLGFIFASVIAIPIATITGLDNIVINVWQILIGIVFLGLGILIGYKLGDK